MELCEELDEMISCSQSDDRKQYLTKIKRALKTNQLMNDFYWDTDELPQFRTLEKHNVCMATNGIFFKKDAYGLWADISISLYQQRKVVKGQMLSAEKEIEALKQDIKHSGSNEEKQLKLRELERFVANKHTEQLGIKIALNSFF